ncbi:hypothetical protein BUALT_BualtUnG0022700 [Buddleja alternifolia]|uniref:Uncharacterized protein n=1 Tax=Buddleja alternifolia TaxID=168488 RepID=A0AAV6W102_9LAMI|nr:hypothetical protein BUALT_BualtUnG0022700 [Buddleja alternifolia]
MTTENEPAKLLLSSYLQRADELQKHEPLVAYYCRLYAMDRGMRIPQKERTKTTNALLVSLMNQLEKDKKSLQLGPDDHLHVEGFASSVFARADKQDRAGRSDLNTAKTFYAASIFFEILNQFADVQPDVIDRFLISFPPYSFNFPYYSLSKTEICCMESSRYKESFERREATSTPGPPGGEKDLSVPSSTSSGEYDVNPSRNDFPTAPDPSRRDPSATLPPDSDLSPQPYDKVNCSTLLISHHNLQIFHLHLLLTSHRNIIIPPMATHLTIFINRLQPTLVILSHITINHTIPNLLSSIFPNYPSQDLPSSFPNFQSYPSFNETTYTPTRSGNVPEASPTTTQNYEYDSNYQPSPEKIAEAHKAARFAVGALAFDDVSIAVDHLKKSLELLTNPSATH